MRVVYLSEEAKRIEARKRLLRLDDARFAAARNMGAARTASKRQLLQALADEASLQGRKAPFAGHRTA